MTDEQFGLFHIDYKGMEVCWTVYLVVFVGIFKSHNVVGSKIVYYKQKVSPQSGHIRVFE